MNLKYIPNNRNKGDSYEIIKKHPFGTCIPDSAHTLTIGSFPTREDNYKSTFKFFYAGKGNQFWPVMEEVFNCRFSYNVGKPAINERIDFLRQNRIGLTDMISKCYRRNKSSLDKDIFPIQLNDLFSLLRSHDQIKKIILTGRQPVVGVLGLFETYFYQKDIDPPKFSKNTTNNVLSSEMIFQNRKIKVYVPYSTSNTIITKGTATFPELVSMYEYCLRVV